MEFVFPSLSAFVEIYGRFNLLKIAYLYNLYSLGFPYYDFDVKATVKDYEVIFK